MACKPPSYFILRHVAAKFPEMPALILYQSSNSSLLNNAKKALALWHYYS